MSAVRMPRLAAAVERARRWLLDCGRENAWAYVVRDHDEFGRVAFEVVGRAEYENHGNEDSCAAALWTYRDDAGQLAVAVETEADW